MPNKDVTFTYYRPTLYPDLTCPDLSSILLALRGKSPQERVIRHSDGDLIQLSSVRQNEHNLWELQFARYRHGIIPELGNPSTADLTPIVLPPNYQLAEVVSVLYDPDPNLNVFLLQHNKSALNSNAIASYFTRFLAPQDPPNPPQQINLELVLKPNAFNDIRNLGSVKKVIAQIKNPHDPTITAALNQTPCLGSIMADAQSYAPNLPVVVEISIAVTTRKFDDSIDHERLINTLRPLVDIAGNGGSNIKKMEVFGKGTEDDERNYPINLLKYRLEEKKGFDVPRGTAIPHIRIIEYMGNAYSRRREYLRSIFNED